MFVLLCRKIFPKFLIATYCEVFDPFTLNVYETCTDIIKKNIVIVIFIHPTDV